MVLTRGSAGAAFHHTIMAFDLLESLGMSIGISNGLPCTVYDNPIRSWRRHASSDHSRGDHVGKYDGAFRVLADWYRRRHGSRPAAVDAACGNGNATQESTGRWPKAIPASYVYDLALFATDRSHYRSFSLVPCRGASSVPVRYGIDRICRFGIR